MPVIKKIFQNAIRRYAFLIRKYKENQTLIRIYEEKCNLGEMTVIYGVTSSF